jgi:hypothetical protein
VQPKLASFVNDCYSLTFRTEHEFKAAIAEKVTSLRALVLECHGGEDRDRSANPMLTFGLRWPKIAGHEDGRSTSGDGAAAGVARA